jgi:hypothetical protein
MNQGHRNEIERALKAVIGLYSGRFTYALERDDGKYDLCDRNGTITIADKPPAAPAANVTKVLIFEAADPATGYKAPEPQGHATMKGSMGHSS